MVEIFVTLTADEKNLVDGLAKKANCHVDNIVVNAIKLYAHKQEMIDGGHIVELKKNEKGFDPHR